MKTANMNLAVALRRLRWPLMMAAALFVALSMIGHPALAQDDSDFGTIDDPLDGDYELYNVSDLLIARTQPLSSSTESEINNYILETENLTLTTQTKQTVATVPCYVDSDVQPQRTRIGRFFYLDYDAMVTLRPSSAATGDDCSSTDDSNNMVLDTQNLSGTLQVETPFSMSAISTAMTLDDFDGDGFDDLLIMSDGEIFVASAADTTDATQGFTLGAQTAISETWAARSDPTTGDFNGDGLVDVAWIGQDYDVHFATVCDGTITGTVCDDQSAFAVVLDPLEATSTGITVAADGGNCYIVTKAITALTAGDFTDTGRDDLITVSTESNCNSSAFWYQFESDFSLTNGTYIDKETIVDVNSSGYDPITVFAESAHLDWFSNQEQAIIGWGGFQFVITNDDNIVTPYTEGIHVLSFSDDDMSTSSLITKGSNCTNTTFCIWTNGLALGRFADIPDNADSETDYDLQIATLRNDGTVGIYTVGDAPDYTPTLASEPTIDASLALNENSGTVDGFTWLVAGDLQGRSVQLGTPTVVRVESHSQPAVILGMPPMHVDYVQPATSSTADTQIVNITAIPSSYNSQYSVTETEEDQSAATTTSSYSYAYTESAEEKVQVGVPVISSLSGDFTQTWKDTWEATSSEYSSATSSSTFNAATTTGFGDQIWFSSSDFNIYYYPVIGHTVAVTDTDGTVTQQQLYVSFSGPSDYTGIETTEGTTVEWYQPVHEPGNIFSYPWDLTQLQARFGSVDLLTSSSPEPFYTDNSQTTESLSWSQNTGSSQTVGSSQTHSFETDNSISAGNIPDSGFGLSVTGSYDYNSSTSSSSLYQSTINMGTSTGIQISKPAFNNDAFYAYLVRPFIFGQSSTVETAQELTLDTDITTNGPLTTAYIADPTDSNAGAWWTADAGPYTQNIDVALNHPARWKIAYNFGSEESDPSCISYYCASSYAPQPDNLWLSPFYYMRGLFITVGDASGPQRTIANVGDEVYLQARVYNYSLKDMPSDSEIHVQFYRQEITGTTPVGSSVLITEVVTDPLPAFNSLSYTDDANWTTVQTSFTATGEMVDTYYFFWVVAWAEDSSGARLDEVPGHGLTDLPGTLTAVGDTPIEMVTITNTDGTTETTSFSNNVGLYKQKFYVSSTASSDLLGAEADATEGTLRIENVQVMDADTLVSNTFVATADIKASDGAVSGIEVLFFNGDPAGDSTQMHDVDYLPYISSGRAEHVSIPFRSISCGTQNLVIVARSGDSNSAQDSVAFDVPCPTLPHYFPFITR